MIGLVLLVALPLIEIAVLIKVGQSIGFWWTLAIVVGTFTAGMMVLGRSGFTSAIKVREALARGEPPVAAMIDSALVVVAGVLLMTPGLIADAVGLALLVPPFRRWLAGVALRNSVVVGSVRVDGRSFEAGPETMARPEARPEPPPTADGGGPLIEGEFERLDERPIDPRRRPRQPDEPS
ncbi:MAG: FxsA family protein [Hyphomicrobiaceae bacterium]